MAEEASQGVGRGGREEGEGEGWRRGGEEGGGEVEKGGTKMRQVQGPGRDEEV